MLKILLKDGQVGCGLGVYDADVLIENGKIVNTFDWGKAPKMTKKDKVIDCKGKLILPGFIDVHVHFREPGQAYKEDWETGSRAAVSGGVTTVLDMPNNKPPVFTNKDLKAKRELVNGRSYCNYGFYIGFNGGNVEEINKSDAVAVKFYACDSTGDFGVKNLKLIEAFFKKCEKLIVVHAEDAVIIESNQALYLTEYEGRNIDSNVHSKIRSPEAAVKALERVCELALKYGRRIHVAHVSSEGELEVVGRYRRLMVDGGFQISCEVTPHHLLLCDDDYADLKNFIKVNPPVRGRTDIFSLWKGLKFEEIDVIASDHAPHTIVEKEQDYMKAPSGVPELDTFLPIFMNAVNDEGLNVAEVVKLCCERPAKIFGLGMKGQVEPGFDADLVVVDMNLEKKVSREGLFTKCGWSPYEGMIFKGWPVMTFVNGKLAFKDGKVVERKAYGREVEVV